MALSRRVVIVVASAVSAPGVLLAAAACVYILHSLATDAWYRELGQHREWFDKLAQRLPPQLALKRALLEMRFVSRRAAG